VLPLSECVAGAEQRGSLPAQAATAATGTAGKRPQQIAHLPRVAGLLDNRFWREIEGTIHNAPSVLIPREQVDEPVEALSRQDTRTRQEEVAVPYRPRPTRCTSPSRYMAKTVSVRLRSTPSRARMTERRAAPTTAS
jgi:hypothetical protein